MSQCLPVSAKMSKAKKVLDEARETQNRELDLVDKGLSSFEELPGLSCTMAKKKHRPPLKRKVISIETKIEILNRFDNGQTATEIARSLDFNEATVRTIKKNETEIRRAGSTVSSISTKFTNRARAPILEKMERALSIWIDDCYNINAALSQQIIQEKALSIYGLLEQNGEPSSSIDFVASNGWFEKFKKRFSIHSLKFKGEAASADDISATTYPEEIQEFIKEEEILPDQVFNADETGLFWKKMPNRNEANNSQSDDSSSEETDPMSLTIDKLREGFAYASSLESCFLNSDPLIERRLKFKRELEKILLPYKECYKEALKATKQSKITDFYKEPPKKKPC
ncbi:putative CENPB DNA-binding domain-containing protein 1 isoform X1 [Drosophila kikkawai]|uniref:CENPB DNA-binding domain-containing protein 1 isoform X1 n=1 Tax=Drosophila kikkawai TaxID=30033 RepID=A0ABM4GCG1_DROKI